MNASIAIRIWSLALVMVLAAGEGVCAEANENPLVGRWLVIRVGSRDATKISEIEWEFTKDKVIVRDLTNSQEISRNNYEVDMTKDPKWITVTVIDQVREVRAGIFRIKGDELHIKQTIGGGPRPTGFPKEGYSIMKRQPKGGPE